MKKQYLITSIILFVIGILIVLFFSNAPIIRGFLGDVLVIAFLYSLVKIFFDIKSIKLCLYVLIFAYFVEFLQYLEIVELLGLSDSVLARIIIGTTFDILDLLAYTIGAVLTYIFDRKRQ